MRSLPLAASVVMTFSIAGSGCTPEDGPTQNPPPPEVEEPPPLEPEPKPTAADSGAPEPEPEPQPDPVPKPSPQAADEPRIVVQDNGDGSCTKYFRVDCPKGARCNPPPPQTVPCTDDIWPEAQIVANVTKREDGSCWEHANVHCPEGATCNPPPPQRVSCKSAKK
jgi:hypothetical protein